METKKAQALTSAIFGARNGDGAMVERCPEACAAFRIAFPDVAVGCDNYGSNYRADRTMELKTALREWADALPDDDIPF